MDSNSPTPPAKYFLITHPVPYVAHIQINRPTKLNAFFEPMWHELSAHVNHYSRDSSTRCILISGAGPAFTAGLDLQFAISSSLLDPSKGSSSRDDAARAATLMRHHIDDFQACISSIEKCEKPVICAMHGYSYGLAVDLSCCADIRICASDTKFNVKEVDIGIAADIGTLTRLPKVVGAYGWVKEVCLTGRIWDAQEALKVGYVNEVVEGSREEVIQKGIQLATKIAEKSPVAVQGTKELLNWSRDHNIPDGLRYTSVWNAVGVQTADVKEAITATMKKRKPTFEKL
ncbi:MAG: hypothetical protein M1834_008666 [Cirrosporium novae-zelandiae]|nr:MAG: hypothetical protein M1834_008666 [Cirrosporium novae-zelandiae]